MFLKKSIVFLKLRLIIIVIIIIVIVIVIIILCDEERICGCGGLLLLIQSWE